MKYCPQTDTDGIDCKETVGIKCKFGSTISFYETDPVKNDYGQFCMPRDKSQNKALQDKMGDYSKSLYYNSVRTIFRALVITAVASFIFMLLVQCIPKIMFWFAVIVGTLSLIGLATTIILYPSEIGNLTRFIVFGLTALILIIVLVSICGNAGSLRYNIIFLEYSSKFVCARLYTLLLPFVFILLTVAFYFF